MGRVHLTITVSHFIWKFLYRIFYVTDEVIFADLEHLLETDSNIEINKDLSVFIGYRLDIIDMFVCKFNPVFITHSHILLEGDSSITARVCLVEQFTQS